MSPASFLYFRKLIPFLKKWNLVNIILGSLDILAVALAFQLAYILYYRKFEFFFLSKDILLFFLVLLPLWILLLYLVKVAEIPRTKRYRSLLLDYTQASIVVLIAFIFIDFIFPFDTLPRVYVIEVVSLGFVSLFTARMLEYKVFKRYRSLGYNTINVVVIADETSEQFIDRIIRNKEWGYKIITIFTDSEIIREKYEKEIIVIQGKFIDILNDLMEVDLIDEVIYTKSKIIPSEVREMIRSCEEVGVTCLLKIKEQGIRLTSAFRTEVGEYKFFTFSNIPQNHYQLALKKIMDIIISLSVITLFSPLFVAIALLIKLTSRGPVIFRQSRVGLRGRQFNLYKFRTMVANAEDLMTQLKERNEVDGPVFKIRDDPRVTKVGKILRKTGLDELPQLFNVLKGEMSLIGPRPPLQSEIQQYKRWQLRRLSVKPGLSCFWQIKPERNSIRFDKWMELDLAYIDNWSIRLDLLILLKTIGTVFKRSGL